MEQYTENLASQYGAANEGSLPCRWLEQPEEVYNISLQQRPAVRSERRAEETLTRETISRPRAVRWTKNPR